MDYLGCCVCLMSDNGAHFGRFLYHLLWNRSIVCALATSFFSVPLWAQVVVFAVFSVLSIYFLRPRLVELLNSNAHHRVSNADALLGRVGKVTQTIKTGDYGRVQIDGDDWKAESDAAFDIAEGSRVRIVGRESIIVKVEQI